MTLVQVPKLPRASGWNIRSRRWNYLGLSEKQLVRAVERLVADGKFELVDSLLESSGSRFEYSISVANAKRLVYLKLREKNADPF